MAFPYVRIFLLAGSFYNEVKAVFSLTIFCSKTDRLFSPLGSGLRRARYFHSSVRTDGGHAGRAVRSLDRNRIGHGSYLSGVQVMLPHQERI